MASHARPSEKATIKIVNNVKIILSIQLYVNESTTGSNWIDLIN